MKKLLYTLAWLSALALFASCNKEAQLPGGTFSQDPSAYVAEGYSASFTCTGCENVTIYVNGVELNH